MTVLIQQTGIQMLSVLYLDCTNERIAKDLVRISVILDNKLTNNSSAD